jgi:hypothetical protein
MVLVLLCGVSAKAQMSIQLIGHNDIFDDCPSQSNFGRVVVTQERNLADLTDRYNRFQTSKKGIAGWRLHVFFATGYGAQQNAENVKKQIESKYPDYPVYIVYEQPYFRVRVGDFRINEKNKAYALKKLLDQQFPSSWIVADQINFPRL